MKEEQDNNHPRIHITHQPIRFLYFKQKYRKTNKKINFMYERTHLFLHQIKHQHSYYTKLYSYYCSLTIYRPGRHISSTPNQICTSNPSPTTFCFQHTQLPITTLLEGDPSGRFCAARVRQIAGVGPARWQRHIGPFDGL
jgi:hypothetical protein